MLYTVLPRNAKYKAKNFIDTFVYRAGDQVGAWSYAGLGALGLSAAAISLVAVPLAAVWLGIGLWLGRRQRALADSSESSILAPNSH
jgi:AAA family ATP:ADP antiporter